MATSGSLTITASSQGYIRNIDNSLSSPATATDWTNLRDASTGTLATIITTPQDTITIQTTNEQVLSTYPITITRFFARFETGSLPTNSSINSIVLYVSASGPETGSDSIPIKSLVQGEFDGTNFTTATYDDIDFTTPYATANSSWNTGSNINSWKLNSASFAAIKANNELQIALVENSYDYSDTKPNLGTDIEFRTNHLEGIYITIGYDVTFGDKINNTLPGTVKFINNVPPANIIKLNRVN